MFSVVPQEPLVIHYQRLASGKYRACHHQSQMTVLSHYDSGCWRIPAETAGSRANQISPCGPRSLHSTQSPHDETEEFSLEQQLFADPDSGNSISTLCIHASFCIPCIDEDGRLLRSHLPKPSQLTTAIFSDGDEAIH
jgi:hypothetical protein